MQSNNFCYRWDRENKQAIIYTLKRVLTPTPPQGSLTNIDVREPVGGKKKKKYPVSQKGKVHQILVQFYGNAVIFPNAGTDWGFLVIFGKHTADTVTLRVRTQYTRLGLFKSLSNIKTFCKSLIFMQGLRAFLHFKQSC